MEKDALIKRCKTNLLQFTICIEGYDTYVEHNIRDDINKTISLRFGNQTWQYLTGIEHLEGNIYQTIIYDQHLYYYLKAELNTKGHYDSCKCLFRTGSFDKLIKRTGSFDLWSSSGSQTLSFYL